MGSREKFRDPLYFKWDKMKNELDIVNELLSNEKPKETKKKKREVVAYTSGLKDDGVRHLDPPVKEKDASKEPHKTHWVGDCIKLSKEQREKCSMPEDGYLYVKRIASPNYSACVYSPVYWIYGWGNSTEEAVSDCIDNIVEWRKNNPTRLESVIPDWKRYLEAYKHPYDFRPTVTTDKVKPQLKAMNESKTTSDILKGLDL